MDSQILRGTFVSDGNTRYLSIRSDVDWISVTNNTNWSTDIGAHANLSADFYWQRGMPAGTAMRRYWNANGSAVINTQSVTTGFTLYDSSVLTPGAAVATTGYAGANPPVITTGSTAGLTANASVIRFVGGAMSAVSPTLCGIDWLVTALVANTSVTIPTLANAPTAAAGSAGFYRIIPYPPIFKPRRCIVANVTQAVNPTVTTNIAHGYVVGQKISFLVPAVHGMTQLNNLTGTVLTTPTVNTFTMDIDTTAFTAYAWPLVAVSPNSYATVFPFGETATSTYANLLDDATFNDSSIGIILTGGATGPAGINNDIVYWVAGKAGF